MPAAKKIAVRRLRVESPHNSQCHSAALADLDWADWFADGQAGETFYLHVRHRDGVTWHRVYCKPCPNPRISSRGGKLHWIIP